MKNYLILLLLFIDLNSFCQDYQLIIEFQPSFIERSVLKIENPGDTCFIELKSKSFSEKIIIDKSKLDSLFSFLRSDSFTGKGLCTGNDGIDVTGSFIIDDSVKKIDFWSPVSGSQNHIFITMLFNLMNTYLTDPATVKYIEQLEGYFDSGLGLKKLSDKPLTYKLYGTISINENDELISFFSSLPSNKKLMIDMSNFNSMGTRFYPLFYDLSQKNKKLYWINCTESAVKQLTKAGIDSKRIKR